MGDQFREVLAEVEIRVTKYDPTTKEVRLRITQYLDGRVKKNMATGNQQSHFDLLVGDKVTVQMGLKIRRSGVS